MTPYQEDMIEIARVTLIHVAATSGVAAKRLQHLQSLEVDLGLDDAGFTVLAERQSSIVYRLRNDGLNTRIEAEELRDLLVWQVLQLTLARATDHHYARDLLFDMLTQVQTEWRHGRQS